MALQSEQEIIVGPDGPIPQHKSSITGQPEPTEGIHGGTKAHLIDENGDSVDLSGLAKDESVDALSTAVVGALTTLQTSDSTNTETLDMSIQAVGSAVGSVEDAITAQTTQLSEAIGGINSNQEDYLTAHSSTGTSGQPHSIELTGEVGKSYYIYIVMCTFKGTPPTSDIVVTLKDELNTEYWSDVIGVGSIAGVNCGIAISKPFAKIPAGKSVTLSATAGGTGCTIVLNLHEIKK